VLDHHRPDDPGFDRSPQDFFIASSLGQLIETLCESSSIDFPTWDKSDCPYGQTPEPGVARFWRTKHVACLAGDETRRVDCGSRISDDEKGTRPVFRTVRSVRQMRVVPYELVLVAAADHCLGAAYRGACPGVDPDDLQLWRAMSRAAFQKRDVAFVLRDIDAAIAAINAAPRITLSGAEVVDLRGAHVPELPEAQARLGVSVLCDGLPDRDGRGKVNLMGTPSACRAFLDALDSLGCDPDSGYGDPSRGIVGAYRAAEASR
jgi:hypothetical protein